MTNSEGDYGFREAVDLMLDETLEQVSSTTKLFLQRPTRGNIEKVAGASLAHMRAFDTAIDQIFERQPDLAERLAMINTFAAAAEHERVRIINEAAGAEVCEALPLAYYLTDDEEIILGGTEEENLRPLDILGEVDTDDFTEEDLCQAIKEGIITGYYGNIAADLVNLRLFKASRGIGRVVFWGEQIGEHSGSIAKVAGGIVVGYKLAKYLEKD